MRTWRTARRCNESIVIYHTESPISEFDSLKYNQVKCMKCKINVGMECEESNMNL